MLCNFKNINRFTNLIFFIACAVHIVGITINIVDPKLPDIRQYKKDLKDIEFPVSFQICVDEINPNNSRFKDFGYEGLHEFFKGVSRFNSSLIGWAGHRDNKSTFESVEGTKNHKGNWHNVLFSEVLEKLSFNWSSIVSEISFWTSNEYRIIPGKNIHWSLVPQYPSCQIINVNEYIGNFSAGLVEVNILLGKIENLEVSLRFLESNKVLLRSLKTNILAYSGPILTIRERNRRIRAVVRISQEIYSPEDNTAKCQNYPNGIYESYNDCDQSLVNDIMKNSFNITPFWSTKNLDSVTKLRKYSKYK